MIATTKDQTQRLLRCGVSADTADMSWFRGWGNVGDYDLNLKPYNMLTRINVECCRGRNEVAPAWSLSRLLGLLPKRIKRGICSDYTLSLSCDGCFWNLEYTYARYRGEDDSLVLFEDTDPIEVCVKAIEWLRENNYKLNEL